MKKIFGTICISGIIYLGGTLVTSAQTMNIYVNNILLQRDIQAVQGYDMIPIMDISNELGYECYYDGTVIDLYNDNKSYKFTIGSPNVFDESGKWYGLDVVPQEINGKVRIPAKFFTDNLGMSYVWDSQTNTLFLNSEETYNWLIGTDEYKYANTKYMANWYYNFMVNMDTLYVQNPSHSFYNPISTYHYDELWYYLADVNYDGILDLTISAEDYLSNGVIIYSLSDRIIDEGMPFSAGVERFTLAKMNNRYGIFWKRYNSVEPFSFSYFLTYDKIGIDTYGDHYGSEYRINERKVNGDYWYEINESIEPVSFYNIWQLKSLS